MRTHTIRHLTASILAQANVPMVQRQTIIRHKNLATPEKCIKWLEDLRPAFEFFAGAKKAFRLGIQALSDGRVKQEL